MSALHQYISAVGSFQGMLLFILLVADRQTTSASKVLGLYCLTMGLAFFLPFITFGVADEVFRPLAVWLFFLPLMYGPLLYLYCSKVVFNAPLKRSDLLHVFPLLVGYVLNIDSLFWDHEAFRLWVVGAQAPNARVWFSEYFLFVVALTYFIATAVLLRRYQGLAIHTLSNFNPLVFRWLGLLVTLFIITILAKGVMAFSDFFTLPLLVISDGLIMLGILVIALTQWKKPSFFQIGDQSSQENVEKADSRNISSSNGLIEPETREAMFDVLLEHMEQVGSYRDSELNLSKLAVLTGLSSHHLSEVLNQHAGKNFNQFINEYRINEVCNKLESDRDTPVLDIALEAGFSSKSTFNTIFKKYVGMTPTQFRQQGRDE